MDLSRSVRTLGPVVGRVHARSARRARVHRCPSGYVCRHRAVEGGVVAELSDNKRENLPAKDFGLPEKARSKAQKKQSGNYPMPDEAHARNAKARAAQQRKPGKLT